MYDYDANNWFHRILHVFIEMPCYSVDVLCKEFLYILRLPRRSSKMIDIIFFICWHRMSTNSMGRCVKIELRDTVDGLEYIIKRHR